MRSRTSRHTTVGLAVVGASAVAYWLSNRDFNAGRGDFFFLAEAFLEGRTWLDFQSGIWDVIPLGGDRYFVPFGPMPAVLFMPLVALIGAPTADDIESGLNALLAAASVGLCWMLLGRLGVQRLRDRTALVVLFAFSTSIWWVTTRGGVWHTGQLVATILTFACLVELEGRRRPEIVGLLAGAAFLSRAPLALAVPFYMLLVRAEDQGRTAQALREGVAARVERWRIREALMLAGAALPSIAFFFWYNAARFGSPFESGYALATLPDWLEERRRLGLFSTVHVGMNLDLLVFRLPERIPEIPYFRPDGHGLSVLFTSPGLLLAAFAPSQSRRAWWLAGAALAVLVPTLLYYGGGWLQFGYRYFLDSIPFLIALAGMAVAAGERVGIGWAAIIGWGVFVNLAGVHWAYRL